MVLKSQTMCYYWIILQKSTDYLFLYPWFKYSLSLDVIIITLYALFKYASFVKRLFLTNDLILKMPPYFHKNSILCVRHLFWE